MVIIDTNILVSELLHKYEQDENTLQYRRFYQQLPLVQRVIPDFILNEFEIYMTKVAPSRYRMDEQQKKTIRKATSIQLEELIHNCTVVSPSPATIKNAFALYKRFENDHYISFTDSLLLAVAKDSGYTLLTKDRRVINRAKELDIHLSKLTK